MGRVINQLLSKVFQLNIIKQYWVGRYQSLSYDNTPWIPLKKPLSEAKVAFVSTAGIHLESDQAFDMTNKNGDPTLRSFPKKTNPKELTITHDYYNHADANQDINVVFPFLALEKCLKLGLFKELSEFFYSFMGHIEGKQIKTLLDKSCPKLLKQLVEERVDVVLIAPA